MNNGGERYLETVCRVIETARNFVQYVMSLRQFRKNKLSLNDGCTTFLQNGEQVEVVQELIEFNDEDTGTSIPIADVSALLDNDNPVVINNNNNAQHTTESQVILVQQQQQQDVMSKCDTSAEVVEEAEKPCCAFCKQPDTNFLSEEANVDIMTAISKSLQTSLKFHSTLRIYICELCRLLAAVITSYSSYCDRLEPAATAVECLDKLANFWNSHRPRQSASPHPTSHSSSTSTNTLSHNTIRVATPNASSNQQFCSFIGNQMPVSLNIVTPLTVPFLHLPTTLASQPTSVNSHITPLHQDQFQFRICTTDSTAGVTYIQNPILTNDHEYLLSQQNATINIPQTQPETYSQTQLNIESQPLAEFVSGSDELTTQNIRSSLRHATRFMNGDDDDSSSNDQSEHFFMPNLEIQHSNQNSSSQASPYQSVSNFSGSQNQTPVYNGSCSATPSVASCK